MFPYMIVFMLFNLFFDLTWFGDVDDPCNHFGFTNEWQGDETVSIGP